MPPITERQERYIWRLLREHPSHPLADTDNDEIDYHLAGLDRTEASALIDELINWEDRLPRPSVPVAAVPTAPVAPVAPIAPVITASKTAGPEPEFVPSHYMTVIFETEQTTTANICVEAVAGSGKTTYLLQQMKRLDAWLPEVDGIASKRSILFCAFSKAIADELRTKAPEGVDVSTLHSLGFRALRNADRYIQLDEKAVKTLITGCLPGHLSDEDRYQATNFTEKMVGMLKNTLVDPGDRAGIARLMERHNVDDNGIGQIIIPLLPYIFSELDRSRYITFDDMIYRVAKFGIPMPHYDVVMVDECQDLNPAQITMVQMLHAAGARVIAVGDRSQSIFGFRGADTEAIPRLIESLKMISLPLSICYRCPTSHIQMAKALVPQIEPRDDAPEGRIERMTWDRMMQAGDEVFTPGKTLVMCRKNAPLVGRAFQLLRLGIPAQVKGRDIGQGMLALIRKLSRPGHSLGDLLERANAYHSTERQKLVKRDASESRLQALDDQMETLYALCDGVDTIDAVQQRVNAIFSDVETTGAVQFSSIHRAKGLQAERTVILEPWSGVKAKQDWEIEQERNIRYVSLTRSTDLMVFEEKSDA